MPRNPITYFKTNLMQSLNTSLNDSQNSVVYPIDVQKKIEEVYKRVQAPSNTVNINYNSGNGLPESNIVQKLTQKLSMANEAISNLKKLGNNNEPNKLHSKKVKEIASSDLQKIKDALSPSNEDSNDSNNDSRFKEINNNSKTNKIDSNPNNKVNLNENSLEQLIKNIKASNLDLKDASRKQDEFLKSNNINKDNIQIDKNKLSEINKISENIKDLNVENNEIKEKNNLKISENLDKHESSIIKSNFINDNKSDKTSMLENRVSKNVIDINSDKEKELLIEKSISDSFEKLKKLMDKPSLENENENKKKILLSNYNFIKESRNMKLKQIDISNKSQNKLQDDGAISLDEIF